MIPKFHISGGKDLQSFKTQVCQRRIPERNDGPSKRGASTASSNAWASALPRMFTGEREGVHPGDCPEPVPADKWYGGQASLPHSTILATVAAAEVV